MPNKSYASMLLTSILGTTNTNSSDVCESIFSSLECFMENDYIQTLRIALRANTTIVFPIVCCCIGLFCGAIITNTIRNNQSQDQTNNTYNNNV